MDARIFLGLPTFSQGEGLDPHGSRPLLDLDPFPEEDENKRPVHPCKLGLSL